VTQLVTFSLADSFPVTRRAEWEPLLREPDESVRRRQLEAWLDRGYGECWLRQPAVAALVETSLLGGHGYSYRLQAWVIMPNHAHLARAVRYVDNNPTRARFVRHPADWRRSSARRRDAYGRLPERLEAE
jgi:hypothetical protein